MKYKALNQVKVKELVECINMSFSDYAKPIHFTEDTLQNFFKISDINKSLSFCAYSDNIIVGFIINSSNIYNGEQVVFDACTGVIIQFRNNGIFCLLCFCGARIAQAWNKKILFGSIATK